MRAVHQLLPALHSGDAVGNEARHFRRVLREAGYDSELFAGWTDPTLSADAEDLDAFVRRIRPGDVTLFHFGPGPASRALAGASTRRVLRYHNVTPPELLAPHAPELARLCVTARDQLSGLAGRVELALPVSEFNRAELLGMGYASARVVPLALDLRRLRLRSRVAEGLYDDGRPNVLVVGRLAPNKRLEDVIESFALYQRLFAPRARLVLAGSGDGFEPYVAALSEGLRRLRVERAVLTGHVSDAELGSLYRSAHVLLSLSAHEGYCAPLVEAMAAGVPVVARAAGAVEETLGGAGILLRDARPELVAGVLDALDRDDELRASVLEGQRRRLTQLDTDAGASLLAALEPLWASGGEVRA